MSEYKVQVKYVDGLNILFNNPTMILSKKNTNDYNGYSKIYFDKVSGDLIESYYNYDDCGSDDGVKENGHKINLKNDFLYIDGSRKENIIFYIEKKWFINYNWEWVYHALKSDNRSEMQKEIVAYLADIYYTAIKDMDDEEFEISADKIEFIHDTLSDMN